MTFTICCHKCSKTIGHLHIPFKKLMKEKEESGGNMTDNSDICEKLLIKDDCCKLNLLCSIPDKYGNISLNELLKKK